MKSHKIMKFALVFALILSMATPFIANAQISNAMTVVQELPRTATVIRVVDGDTIVIKLDDGSSGKVRLIGIDTPESVHTDASRNTKWGKKVSNYTKKKLTGKKITLEYDKDLYDPYGRVLAYVYLDGKMYNKTLLKKGYARAVYYAPNGKYKKSFNKLQKTAKKKHKGFWKKGEYKKAFPNG